MKLLSMNDLSALEIVLNQIKDFKTDNVQGMFINGKYRRGYVVVTNDEYHRLNDIAGIIRAEIEMRKGNS